jgi:DNA-binding CsgD family transcriptional regulator
MDDLIGLVYETVAQPESWVEVVRRLKVEFDAQGAWMFENTAAGPAFIALDDVPPRLFADYVAYYHTVDITLQAASVDPASTMNLAKRERDAVGERAWLGSEVYHDHCLPNGISQIMASHIVNDVPGGHILSFFRAPGAALFDDPVVRSYDCILPHIRRALRLRSSLASQMPAPGWTSMVLEGMAAAIILLDGNGRVLHLNAAARSLLDRKDGLLLRGGRLSAKDHSAARSLEKLLAQACSGRTRGGDILLPSRTGAMILSACPLAYPSAAFGGHGNCRAWVWISGTVQAAPDLPKRLGALFGLTTAEQRIAAGIATGLTAAEIAAANAVSLSTVRTQIQAIFAKTGVSRQAELVQLLANLQALPSRR